MFVPTVLGFERYVFTSGSMTGSLNCGSILYAGERNARMLVIGLPALLVGLSVLAGLWREAGANIVEPASSEAQTGAA